ncbi:Sorting nexin-2 like protein [Argiope bruennichi]|uniref:Sorting nexin-2 like protein n=1 Tax=Argiope bruennichi TaxID=94029 RepID=A0A8T0FAJ7_ARGBR|nr:Sorting nexin-2 like protein [Argiope bruennichi]
MADSREPPPFEETHGDAESEDIFKSAVESQPKEELSRNGIDDLMSGGGEEVSLDDDTPAAQPAQSKLEFRTPEEEFNKSSPVATSPPAEMKISDAPQPQPRKTANKSSEEEDTFLNISVSDPQKIGDGMGAYVVYKVHTKTNLPYYKKKGFSVSRRFSDFLGLHGKLVEKHLHLGRIVPPAPEKDMIGMTKIKMSKDETISSAEFVEKRRIALERYLNRTAEHPVLRMDPDFREFLEMEVDLPKAKSTSALSGAGVMRLFNRVGDSVNKMTFKMDESDPVLITNPQYAIQWFEEKQHQIENLDQQLGSAHKCRILGGPSQRHSSSYSKNIKQNFFSLAELALNTGAFAKSAAMLGNCEEHTALSRALSQLSEVEEKIEQLQSQQAGQDFFLLAELLKDYIALIGAVKDVFHQRVKVYQTWQHAQQVLTKKREQKAKLELVGKTDKIPQAKEEVIEWEAKSERGQEEFENISKMIRKEVERFEKSRVHDFKVSIIKYMESLLETQQQLIKHWEAFLPEAKAIA